MKVKKNELLYKEPSDTLQRLEEQLSFLKERLGSFLERNLGLYRPPGKGNSASPTPSVWSGAQGPEGAIELMMTLLAEAARRQVKVSTKGGSVLWLACDETATKVSEVKATVVRELRLESVVGLTNASRVGKRGRSKGGGAADSERAEGGKKRGGKKRLLDMVADDLQKAMHHEAHPLDEVSPTMPIELHLLPDWPREEDKCPLEAMTEDELKSNSYQNSDLLYEDKDKLELARREDGNIELQLIYSHEMRAVPLGSILEFEIWQEADFTQDAAAKAMAYRSLWRLGTRVTECDHFVSHSWKDEKTFPKMKVKMMRGFLCLQQLVARLLVAFTLIGVFFIPLGFAVEAIADEAAEVQRVARGGRGGKGEGSFREGAFKWYYPTLATSFCLAGLISWIVLSDWGCVRSRWAPWAMYGMTLWLDKCCVLQDNNETVAAGVAGFSRFLNKCDKMIAFVSPSYFSRLWCVYELATFCRENEKENERRKANKEAKGRDIHERLLLLSLSWPGPLSPVKSDKLTLDERSWFENFSALKVQCTKPADRATVFGEIRRTWGLPDKKAEDASDSERMRDPKAHEYFDSYVRDKLVDVFARSKQRYSREIKRNLAEQFQLAFGSQ